MGGARVYNRARAGTTEPGQRATPSSNFFYAGKKFLVAAVATPRVTGFAHLHFSEFRQGGLQSGPNPPTKIFACRVIKPFDVIQVMMVQLFQQRTKGLVYFIEIHDPAGLGIDLALNSDADMIGVAV